MVFSVLGRPFFSVGILLHGVVYLRNTPQWNKKQMNLSFILGVLIRYGVTVLQANVPGKVLLQCICCGLEFEYTDGILGTAKTV